VLVLDMGEPVRIADVAQRFADQHSPPLEIVFTGLRPGEKLHEDLIDESEAGDRPFHPMITHVMAQSLAFEQITVVEGLGAQQLVDTMRAQVAAAEPSVTL
jgi:FlaA1/EpsC-like NDP-sugar epimerase